MLPWIRILLRKLLGSVLILCGIILSAWAIVAGVCIFSCLTYFSRSLFSANHYELIVILLVAVVIATVISLVLMLVVTTGSALIQIGQSLSQPLAMDIQVIDHRRPVLFLRSFDDDVKPINPHLVIPSLSPYRKTTEKLESPQSYERVAVRAFKTIGPVRGRLEIGLPGRRG